MLKEAWEKTLPKTMRRKQAEHEAEGLKRRTSNEGGGAKKKGRNKEEGEMALWEAVKGSISATQATLADLNWLPTSPDRWLDPTR